MGASRALVRKGEHVDIVHERCCGLDIHKRTVVACAIVPGPQRHVVKEVRTFGTMTSDLLELADWLAGLQVTWVAMESTGVYWKPVWNLLEEGFELVLLNAQHIKAVPGRKTDVKDCEWIADLLQHGLLRGSFVPDREQRELRELTRYRRSLVVERTAEINRLQKTLEGANIKLASVASNVLGVSARAMLHMLLGGSTDASAMAQLAKGRLRDKIPQLERALAGRFGPPQRFLVAQQLTHCDFLDEAIAQVNAEIEARMQPYAAQLARLDSIPGVGQRAAEEIIAQIGVDMSRFPTHRHLASWAGMCPGNNESAGKRKSGKTRKGNGALRAILLETAQAAARSRGSYLSAQYHRLATRRGKKKAAVAVGHSILVAAYYLLQRGTVSQDLGHQYFDQRDRDGLQRRLIKRLEALGNRVSVEPVAA
jgi:transposase